MKRALAVLLLAAAVPAFAVEPLALDRDGVLWRLEATPAGVALVGTKDGEEVARSLVPFGLGVAGQGDHHLQLVADATSGKVVVAWERRWSDLYRQIMLATWTHGSWERIAYLAEDAARSPRNPVLRLATATSTVPDPQEPEKQLTLTETFALVLWWEGQGAEQQANLAVLRLQAGAEESDALHLHPLPTSPGIGLGCDQTLPPEALEHPVFASAPPGPVSHALVASPTTCLLFVHEIRFKLEEPPVPEDEGGLQVVGLRRRHTPIFGVRKVLPVTRQLAAEGTRAVLGSDLQPVLYRVTPEGIEYTVASQGGWTPKRMLKLEQGLTLDRALALVQELAR